ncbi:MAG TPA: SGNH/GDSL hydrolase family protein [Solirubrobacteraceae bacterium]
MSSSRYRQHRPVHRTFVVLLCAALFVVLYVLLPAPSAAAHGARHDHAPGRYLRHHSPGSHLHFRGHFPSHPGHMPPRSYLALGDSLAFGYSEGRFEENAPEESPTAFETGYVNDFGAVLQRADPSLEIVNDGCPGETTESFINGPCAYQLLYPLHHPYAGGKEASQLSDALNYIAEHREAVDPITIDIGANDALALIEGCKEEASCIEPQAPTLFAKIGANLAHILAELRAAAPHAEIVVVGLYNPFGESIMGGDALTASLNEVMQGDARAVGASFADPLPAFNHAGAHEQQRLCLLTNMCETKPDIHPTDLGYRVLAHVVLAAYLEGLPEGREHRDHGRAGHCH